MMTISIRTLLLLVLLAFSAGRAYAQTNFPIFTSIPSYLPVTDPNITDDVLRSFPMDYRIHLPLGLDSVTVQAGFFEGDSSLLVRTFPMGEHVWPDSTKVTAANSGHQLTFGRFAGIKELFILIRSGSDTIGYGNWSR